ncbi:hypothetical protein AB0D27_09880, partial [Streptomyces sp. NPDC048415]|uniref:hypothetical protein n=1 Tax=Streptomyces sp. NPDC048415 TaxID=3154822 RepID=UPI00344A2313
MAGSTISSTSQVTAASVTPRRPRRGQADEFPGEPPDDGIRSRARWPVTDRVRHDLLIPPSAGREKAYVAVRGLSGLDAR